MGASGNRAQRRKRDRERALAADRLITSSSRELGAMSNPAPPRPVVGVRDAPAATLLRWRGELYADLLWGDVVSIMRAAETTGATETWARLTRRMYQDGQILSDRGTRVDPIAGARFDVDAGGPTDFDRLAAADTAEMMRSLPNLPELIDHELDAIFVGYAVAETIWEPRGQWVWPAAIELLEPHRIRFDQLFTPYLYDDGRLAGDPGANPSIQLLGKPLRTNKFIVHMPRALPDYAIAAGLLRACARYWWAKWWGVRYWMSGAEVSGNPRMIGKFPGATTDAVRQEWYEALQNVSADGIFVMDKESELQILNAAAQGDGSIFDALTRWADNGITKTILGSTLNSMGGDTAGGNRALGESQGERTIDPRMVKDASSWWATFRRDLVRPFLEFNLWRYGGRMPAIPIIKSVFTETPSANVDADLIDVGGVTIDEVRSARGLPEWGEARGGNRVARRAPSYGAPMPAAEAAAAVPFAMSSKPSPWDAAMRIATSPGATVTSSR